MTEEKTSWKTGISQAFWCHASEKKYEKAFEPAVDIDGKEKSLCWFDKMLGNGITLPDTTYQPLTFLFTGRPGAGKTTFALELVYRLINNKINKYNSNGMGEEHLLNDDPIKRCLYISTESTSKQIISKAKNFKWKNVDEIFTQHKKYTANKKTGESTEKVIVCGTENIKSNNIKTITQNAINSIEKQKTIFTKYAGPIFIIGLLASLGFIPENIRNLFIISTVIPIFVIFIILPLALRILCRAFKNRIIDSDSRFLQFAKPIVKQLTGDEIDVLVIDSLNSLRTEKSKEEAFSKFLQSIHGQVKLVVFLLDSDDKHGRPKFWEYICDTVIRMDSEVQNGYWLRTIEIEKARYQKHVQGKQILKIEPGLIMENDKNPNPCHSHPYRTEGGLFIFPSIHYYLSYYKKHLSELNIGKETHQHANQNKNLQTYAKLYPYELNNLIATDRLIPEGRCTAFIGNRGGHKSHLGYVYLLHQMIIKKESSLIISLRDDEEMTRQAMITILMQEEYLLEKAGEQKYLTGKGPRQIIEWFEKKGRMEILYYHPGYITPEEFCHRMIMSVQHIKHDGLHRKKIQGTDERNLPVPGNWEKLTVLFNSLDQLTSRFPLCTKQDIFVPGLIDSLTGENVTSIFVAVSEDQHDEQYGLTSMADLILLFRPRTFNLNRYCTQLLKLRENDNASLNYPKSKEDYKTIEVEIKRFAGGEKSGAKGTLELINSKAHKLYEIFRKTGLHFNQIDKTDDKRESKRKTINLSGQLNLEKISVKNISSKGMLLAIKTDNISNLLEKQLTFQVNNRNIADGEIIWFYWEKGFYHTGFQFKNILEKGTFENMLGKAQESRLEWDLAEI